MSTTNLIIQSPGLSQTAVEQFAAISQAQGVQRITASAARLLKVDESDDCKAEVNTLAQRSGLDVAYVSPRKLSECKVLAMDMDSTLINIECIDEIAAFGGVKDQVASITEAAMRGEIKDFSESLVRRVAYLQGLSTSVLQAVYDQRLQLNPGAQTLIDSAKQAGLKILLVSGGFTFFTDKLKIRLGLDAAHANTLGHSDGLLTGIVEGKILDAQGKADTLKAFAGVCGASRDQIIAIGDGANDLKMLALADFSVAYRAKPVVRAQANYALNVAGLDGVLNWFES